MTDFFGSWIWYFYSLWSFFFLLFSRNRFSRSCQYHRWVACFAFLLQESDDRVSDSPLISGKRRKNRNVFSEVFFSQRFPQRRLWLFHSHFISASKTIWRSRGMPTKRLQTKPGSHLSLITEADLSLNFVMTSSQDFRQLFDSGQATFEHGKQKLPCTQKWKPRRPGRDYTVLLQIYLWHTSFWRVSATTSLVLDHRLLIGLLIITIRKEDWSPSFHL